MKCNQMKAEIKRLKKELGAVKIENSRLSRLDERVIDFNLLEIVVRPRRSGRLCRYEWVGVDLRAIGTDQVPTICNYKTISMSTLDVLMENKQSFIKHIGEIMAGELLRKGEEVMK